jgi:hypothetical protein
MCREAAVGSQLAVTVELLLGSTTTLGDICGLAQGHSAAFDHFGLDTT